jgi:phosphoribosylformylglycinamidine synthase
VILLLGRTGEDIDGSAWAEVIHEYLGGKPPVPDFEAEKALAKVLIAASKAHLLSSAHDLSDGGLAVALAESAIRGGLGARVDVDGFVALFSETPARVLVSLPEANLEAFTALLGDLPYQRLGEVSDDGKLTATGLFELELATLRSHWATPIPTALKVSS